MRELLKKLIQAEPTGDKGELAAAQMLSEYLSSQGKGLGKRLRHSEKSTVNNTSQHVSSLV